MTTSAGDDSVAATVRAAQVLLSRTLGRPVTLTDAARLTEAELAGACPAMRDAAAFETAMALMCGYWLIGTLGWQLEGALQSDGEWGIATVRGRIIGRLAVFPELVGGELPGLYATAQSLARRLAARWPDTEPLPLYPAFRG